MVALFFALCASVPVASDGALLVVGGRLFDGLGDEARANPGLLLQGGRIAAIGEEALEAESAQRLELEDDCTILPGLIDLHAHYAVDLFGRGRVDETEVQPLVYLANGVTSTFPAGEVQPERMAAMKRAIDAGERPGPRVYRSGPYFGRWRRGWDEDVAPEALVAEIEHWADEGITCFKAKGISPDHLRILIETAHERGLTVTAHLDSGFRSTVNPKDAVLWGIDRVEHFLGGDALPADRPAYTSLEKIDPNCRELAEVAALYVEHRTYFDATITAYGYFGARDPEVYAYWIDEREFFTPFVQEQVAERDPPKANEQFERIYQVKHETLKALVKAGGLDLITVGTDHASTGEFLPGFGMHRELFALTRSGLTPARAIRCATRNAANALHLGGELGTIEVGKRADLCVVEGDPLEDIRATRAVRLVVKDGKLYRAEELLEAARGRLGPVDAEHEGDWAPPRGR